MRIRRLSARDFRRYRELDIAFAPGLTVVRGPNEAGKTTVQRALELVLTRRATSTAAELEALRPWDAPPEARSIVSIEFEQEDEDGPKTGTVEKTFAGSKGTVRLDYDGQSITDPALADQVLAELTGIPTEAFFRSTASVHAFEMSDLAGEDGALRDRLQASISGADRGTSQARRKLDRALHDLMTKGERNPGRLKVAELAVTQAKAALEQGELALAQLEHDRDGMSTARDRRAEAEVALGEQRSLLEKARQAERIGLERDAATERYDRFRQAVDIATEIDGLASTHPSPHPLPVTRAAVERLRTMDRRITELKAALSGEVEVQFEVKPATSWQPLSRWSIALVILGLEIAGIAFVAKALGLADPGPTVQAAGGIIAGVGLVLAAVALWLRRNDKLQGQLRDVEIDRRLRGRLGDGSRAAPDRSRPGATARDARPGRPRQRRGPALPRGGARRPDRPARGTAERAGRQGAARDPADPARCGCPRDRAEDECARGAWPDRQGAARPGAPGGGGPRPGGCARASARRRGQCPGPGRGQRRRRRTGRRPGRAARDRGRSSWRRSSDASASTT